MKVGIIGYGNMGSAIAKGLFDSYDLVIYNRTADKIDLQVNIVDSAQDAVDLCDIVILAVKPHMYEEILTGLDIGSTTIMSIGAGITSKFMSKYCQKYVLTMPNTAAMHKQAITSVVKSDVISYQDVVKMCMSFGTVVEIDEDSLPEYTVLFGSSPAFFYHFVDCFSSQFDVDSKIIAKHFIACSKMLLEEEANILRDNVCSEGGVTIEGIKSLQTNNFDNIIKKALDSSVSRYKDMELE